MKYLFFINPTAGKGKLQQDIIDSINSHFLNNGGDFEIYITEYQGHAEELARKAAQTGQEIRCFACGGEGTVFEVLNGIVGFDNTSLGVIPCGSANDFLKQFAEKNAFLDIDALVNGEAVGVDIIKAGDRYCINGCSVGMDAMVARDMSIFKRIPLISGSLAYKLAIALNFIKKLGVTIDICIDGKNKGTKRCLFAVVANASYYGGGYMAAPDAYVNDGELDFTMVDVISRFKILNFLPKYEKGDIKGLDFCELEKCKSMSFEADKPIPVNLDGEIITVSKMDFSIVEKGIKFIFPKGVFLPLNGEIENFVNKS